VRLIEIRLLEGPNLYRLVPVVKVEVAIGRRRTWYGRREPEQHSLVELGAHVPPLLWPTRVRRLVAWVRRLRREHPDEARGGVNVHRSSDPGHWIVTWPWTEADRAEALAAAALALADRDVSPDPRADLTRLQARVLARHKERLDEAHGRAPAWIRNADRQLPIVSISGTNGKTTTTRLIAHILREAGHRVGATTSDGIVVDGSMLEEGDWTGPGGAQSILARDDIDIAVLETARGGILLKGVGYESNEASVITNVSSDHLDMQGIHTLPELAEVKATIARITKADGWVVLNADDRYVAAIRRRVRARVALFSMDGDASVRVRRHLRSGGRVYLVRAGWIGEAEGTTWRPLAPIADVPIALGGIARHNVANALAAAGAARAMGAPLDAVKRGLRSFHPTTEASRGRLNVFRDDRRIVVIDFAHNEAGVGVLLDVAEAIARAKGRNGRPAPVTAIVGLAGDRPDDTLRGVGRMVAERVDRFVQKEMLHYLRGRTRESVLGEIRAGAIDGGWSADIPVYGSEVEAMTAELDRTDPSHAHPGGPATEVIFLMCHEQREEVFDLVAERGLRPVEDPAELAELVGGG
jgi:cyanophycin synthetase